MHISSLIFWEIVKDDFSNSNSNSEYLCEASDRFRQVWYYDENKSALLELATQFLENNTKWNKLFHSGNIGFLFVYQGHSKIKIKKLKRAIRMDFINWNINRLTNNGL